MRFGDDWLKEWVRPVPPVQALAHTLTMGGLEVDSIEPAAPGFQQVVVARIVRVTPHPQADRLKVCEIDDGRGEMLQVVCGAANAREELRVPLARVGASLPGDLVIKAARLRGVESFGMLCSARELGLAESADGLLELPADAPIGKDVRAYLDLDAHVLDIDLTPNRGDCLSVLGVAREVAALTGAQLAEPDLVGAPVGNPDATQAVVVTDVEACPVYLGRVVDGFDPQAQTPLWMRERLRRAGLRSLGPMVDVTNYVLLELGQPLHAFDLDRISGHLQVRWAKVGESLRLLTGPEIILNTDELVIADEDGAVALAGIMGGSRSAVTDETTRVFLECAHFAPNAVAGRARRHGLHTEASQRYERGVDPTLQRRALERATELLLQMAGGRAGPVICAHEAAFTAMPITLRHARVERLLGSSFPREQIEALLDRLNMSWQRVDSGWDVCAPAYRFDIKIEVDLIEELIRLRGYDALEARAPRFTLKPIAAPEIGLTAARVRHVLAERGYHEVITYSFVDPAIQAAFLGDERPIDLINPLSRDLSQMRTTLWPGLVQAFRSNLKRQSERVRIFEVGKVFRRTDSGIVQRDRFAGLVHGPTLSEQWQGGTRSNAGFFEVKGDLEALVAISRLPSLSASVDTHPALHPGKSARLTVAGTPVGWLGELHPALSAGLDLPAGVLVFEWDLDANPPAIPLHFTALSRFPTVRRDLSLVIPDAVPVGELTRLIREAGGAWLKECILFDVYRGPGLEEGSKSAAFGLIFQDDERTLEDRDVDEVINVIVRHLELKAGARIRE